MKFLTKQEACGVLQRLSANKNTKHKYIKIDIIVLLGISSNFYTRVSYFCFLMFVLLSLNGTGKLIFVSDDVTYSQMKI